MITVGLGHYQLLAQLAKDARSYLEVGTHEGGSLAAVLRGNPKIREVVCVDNWVKRLKEGKPGGHAHIDEMLATMGYRGEVRFVEGDSRRALPLISSTFDLTVVDASHAEEDCLSDLRLVWPKTMRALVLHDIWSHLGVKTALWRFIRELPPGAATASFCAGDHGTMVLFKC